MDDLDSFWLDLKNAKIDELKETTTNRDFLQGAADGGVTAASAIAALQEAGNKTVRDMISASYRAYIRMVRQVIECVRQFYSEMRCFRILGVNGDYRYVSFSNERIAEQVVGTMSDGTPVCRRPIFDIDVRAEKKDPYTRLSHNENLKDLYRMGVFKPENAAEAGILLAGMDFPGVGKVREQVAAQARAYRGEVQAKEQQERVEIMAEEKQPLGIAMHGAERLLAHAAEGVQA